MDEKHAVSLTDNKDAEIASLKELLRISQQSEKEAWRYLPEVKDEIAALRKVLAEVVAVAVAYLADTDMEDVLEKFSTDELEHCVTLGGPLCSTLVESVYRRGFDASIAATLSASKGTTQ